MPSKFRVRGIFRGLVMVIARPLAKAGARPDSVTYVSLLFLSLGNVLTRRSDKSKGISISSVVSNMRMKSDGLKAAAYPPRWGSIRDERKEYETDTINHISHP
jgi:hypothetical protein